MQIVKILIPNNFSYAAKNEEGILKNSLDYQIILYSGRWENALEQMADYKPDIIICDISNISNPGEYAYINQIKTRSDIKIIILIDYYNEDLVKELFIHGISGCVLKEDIKNDLLKSIEEILKGNIYLSTKVSSSFALDYFNKGG